MEGADLIQRTIEEAPVRGIIRPKFLAKEGVEEMPHCKLLCFEEINKRGGNVFSWYDAQKQGAVVIYDDRAHLRAVQPKCTQADYLVHRGAIRNGDDNLENLRRFGVFGNPDSRYPTYLHLAGKSVETGCQVSKGEAITLFVDTKRLLEQRSLFVDPETIDYSTPEAEVWDSYFVLGGIPARAIKSFRIRHPELADRQVNQ